MKTQTKKQIWKTGLLFTGLTVLVAGTAIWAIKNSGSPAKANTSVLTAIPAATGNTAPDKEIAKWQKLVAMNEKDPLGWTCLGDALMQKARETADVTYYGHAEKSFQKALDLRPEYVEAMHGMAWVASTRHEFEKSIEWANKVIARDPAHNGAYGLLGDAAMEMGDYELADKHYQKMIDLRPDISSYSRGAHFLYLAGKTNRANLLMAMAVRSGAPFGENTAWCRAQLAQNYLNGGLVMPAETLLKDSLKQTPNNYHLNFAMGRVEAARKDFPAAIEAYKKAVAIAPQHDALVALGDLYRLTGKADEAEKQYAMVEAIHHLQKANGVRGDSQMARFYADHNRNLPQALEMVTEEYKTRKNLFVTDTYAWVLYKNGKLSEAQKMAKAALRFKTSDPNLYFHGGMIYAKVGLREVAKELLYGAVNINPNFDPVNAPLAYQTLNELGTPVAKKAEAANPQMNEDAAQ